MSDAFLDDFDVDVREVLAAAVIYGIAMEPRGCERATSESRRNSRYVSGY